MIGFFEKNRSYIPGDNGSSLNIPITIKIIALANITVIETCVLLALYLLLVHYLIYDMYRVDTWTRLWGARYVFFTLEGGKGHGKMAHLVGVCDC